MQGNLEEVKRRFYFSTVRFFIRPILELHLPPYKGSTFRGLFGHAFPSISCVRKAKVCDGCALDIECPFRYVFFTPVPLDAKKMKKYPYAPHPFVILPPLDQRKHYGVEDLLEVTLVLIGKGADLFPYFVYAFEQMGKIGAGKRRGKFTVEQVRDVDDELLYEKGKFHRFPKNLFWYDLKSGSGDLVRLKFLTPLRVKFEEKFCSSLEFHILIRALLRRISLLSYFHCGCELQLDFRELINLSVKVKTVQNGLRWVDWRRYSNRQRQKLLMGGLIGEVAFEGDLGPFWPLLSLGEWVHVGKGTSFGFGKYQIIGGQGNVSHGSL